VPDDRFLSHARSLDFLVGLSVMLSIQGTASYLYEPQNEQSMLYGMLSELEQLHGYRSLSASVKASWSTLSSYQ
jgi:hypothetical protein